MTKLEKVIKGLECCKSPNDHEHCPYNTGVHYNDCTYRLLSDTLELLKERSEQLQESINDDWSGAQGSAKERIDAQIERSKWGIFG